MGVIRNDDAILRDACAVWQSGRDGGSTPIRAAARLLTQTRHYFTADFIEEAERSAQSHGPTMGRARALLARLAESPLLTADEWAAALEVESDWVGRGIGGGAQNPQILAALETGVLTMPLWGMSVDPKVARSFGTAFLFELDGPFPAIAAAATSGTKPEERELITGGRYRVLSVDDRDAERRVRLRFESVIEIVEVAGA